MTASIVVVHPTTGEPLPPFLTVSQAAKVTGWSHERVRNQLKSGGIPSLAHSDFGHWAIPTVALLKALGYDVPRVQTEDAAS